MNGATPHEFEGRVEVRKNNGQWSSLSSEHWALGTSLVVCRMLNYSYIEGISSDNVKGSGAMYPYWPDCDGYETSIEQCRQYPVSGNHSKYQGFMLRCGNPRSGKIGMQCFMGNSCPVPVQHDIFHT